MTIPAAPQPSAQPAYVAPTPTGALSWGLGFLAFIPIPYVGFVVTGIVMAAVYPGQRQKSALAAENGRRAANWGLTLIAVLAAMVLLAVMLSFAFRGNRDLAPFASAPFVIYLILGVVHLVTIIRGLLAANRGQVLDVPLAIPFFRAAPTPTA
jgi:uncharacterized Tic20 family protein